MGNILDAFFGAAAICKQQGEKKTFLPVINLILFCFSLSS